MIKTGSPLHKKMQTWRHWLHRYPELALEENKTSDFVAEQLLAMGYDITRGLASTGIVATLHGENGNGKSIGLRADMDALPIEELNTFAHRSQHNGKMHACGHDGHTTMLLGAAAYLKETPDFAGTVHFIFQPAEEAKAGAKVMLDEGLFEQFPCEAVYGMHNWPGMPVGEFAVHQREVMAGSEKINITVNGKSGHAAMPEQGIDPIIISAQIILAAQTIVSRNLSPFESIALSLTMIQGGTARNIIPEQVEIQGLLRYFNPDLRDLAKQRLQQIVEHTATAMNGHATVNFKPGYPATINTPQHAQRCAEVAQSLAGTRHVHLDKPSSMGAEDFAYLLQATKGAYIWIGNGDHADKGGCMLHNAHYDFNDDILPLGANYWIQLVKSCMV